MDIRSKARYTFETKKRSLNICLPNQEPIVIDPDTKATIACNVPSSGAIDGSLIRQILKNGKIFGNDYDGRLGIIEAYLFMQDIFENKTILDLGSNAGHFPIEYIRRGAKKVIAVEGRKEFEDQWHEIKKEIYEIDTDKIEWITADIRDFNPDFDYDILSCLGLVYHLNDAWNVIRKYLKSEFVIIESQLEIGKSESRLETIDDKTKGLCPQEVDLYILEDFEDAINEQFPQYKSERLYAYYWTELEREILFREQVDGNYGVFRSLIGKPKARGLWLLSEK